MAFPRPTSGLSPYVLPADQPTASTGAMVQRYQDNARLNAEADVCADFGADRTGSSTADAAFVSAFSEADIVKVPSGAFPRITQPIEIPEGKTLEMSGYATQIATLARSAIIKDGNFDGIIANGGAIIRNGHIAGETGNGGDGVYVKGGRVTIENFTSSDHGQDGFRWGAKSGSLNANLPRCHNLIALSNSRHGGYIHDVKSTTAPDANAGVIVGWDARSNGGDGLKAESAIDWQIIGFHSATNGGYGFRGATGCEGFAMFMPYVESNVTGELILDSGSANNLVWGVRSNIVNDAYVDNGTDNLILGRNSQAGTRFYVKPFLEFLKVIVNDTAISGQWELRQNATTRALEVVLANTGASLVDFSLRHGGSGDVRFRVDATTAGVTVFHGRASGDSNARYQDLADGRRTYGPGNTASDVTFGRLGVGIVGSAAGHKLVANAGLGVGNSSSASTPGTVVKKTQVFDAAGTSLGYVAIYDAIT